MGRWNPCASSSPASPAAAVPTLRRLAASDHEIARCSPTADPAGPQARPHADAGRADAVELGLPVIEASRVDDAVTEQLAALGADLGVIVAYGALLRRPALDGPRLGWVNLHFSDLPAYPAPHPCSAR